MAATCDCHTVTLADVERGVADFMENRRHVDTAGVVTEQNRVVAVFKI